MRREAELTLVVRCLGDMISGEAAWTRSSTSSIVVGLPSALSGGGLRHRGQANTGVGVDVADELRGAEDDQSEEAQIVQLTIGCVAHPFLGFPTKHPTARRDVGRGGGDTHGGRATRRGERNVKAISMMHAPQGRRDDGLCGREGEKSLSA